MNGDNISKIINKTSKTTLIIGNGINRFSRSDNSSWENLLLEMARRQGVKINIDSLREMSNAEIYDILDLSKPKEDRKSLQEMFSELMADWSPGPHHETLMNWAKNKGNPAITVNFDENLSDSISASFHLTCGNKPEPGFTDIYPWRSYFSTREINSPDKEFGIWHAHGMKKYPRSIRLGLTHYIESLGRARDWTSNKKHSFKAFASGQSQEWIGMHSWLQAFFFNDIIMIGFRLKKDEIFFRWLLFERARLYKEIPKIAKKTWYFVEERKDNHLRKAFFEMLDIEFLTFKNHADIYENTAWH